MTEKRKVLMVCLGNSCRSPIAEAVFHDQLIKLCLQDLWEVDSAALLQYHVGKDPDERAMTILKKHGISEYCHKARLVIKDDFYKYNWIFGMDNYILHNLYTIQPKDSTAQIELLGKYDPSGETNIRDPYFDDNSTGFEQAFTQSVRSIEAFLKMYQ